MKLTFHSKEDYKQAPRATRKPKEPVKQLTFDDLTIRETELPDGMTKEQAVNEFQQWLNFGNSELPQDTIYKMLGRDF